MPKVDLITPEQERTLLSAMRSAVKHANAGDKPTEAVVKSAREHALGPEFTRRLTEAFNASKTVSHLRNTAGEKRAESFELADAGEAVRQLYDGEASAAKTARVSKLSDTDFFADEPKTGQLFKAASEKIAAKNKVKPGLRVTKVAKLQGLRQQLRKAGADLRMHMVKAQETARELFTDAAEMFKQSGVRFDEVERRVVGTYGDAGQTVMDSIWKMADYERFGQKRASAGEGPAVMGQAPVYNTMRSLMQVLDTAGDLHVAYTKYKQAAGEVGPDEAADAAAELAATEPAQTPETAQQQDAVMGDPVRFLELIKGTQPQATPYDQAEEAKAMTDKVVTPGHEASIRSIKARVMLNDLMVNDPVISGYPPADVITAFNQISRMVPGVSTEPLVMRGLVARVLQTGGRFDPHEANTLYQTEAAQRGGRTRGY